MDAYRAWALPYRSYSLLNIGSHKIDFSLRRLSFTMNRSSITQENAKFHMVEPLLQQRFAARVLRSGIIPRALSRRDGSAAGCWAGNYKPTASPRCSRSRLQSSLHDKGLEWLRYSVRQYDPIYTGG